MLLHNTIQLTFVLEKSVHVYICLIMFDTAISLHCHGQLQVEIVQEIV